MRSTVVILGLMACFEPESDGEGTDAAGGESSPGSTSDEGTSRGDGDGSQLDDGAPLEGWWRFAEFVVEADSCGMFRGKDVKSVMSPMWAELELDGSEMTFSAADPGEGEYLIWACDLEENGAFGCAPLSFTDEDGMDWSVDLEGTFVDEAHFDGGLAFDLTCEGEGCPFSTCDVAFSFVGDHSEEAPEDPFESDSRKKEDEVNKEEPYDPDPGETVLGPDPEVWTYADYTIRFSDCPEAWHLGLDYLLGATVGLAMEDGELVTYAIMLDGSFAPSDSCPLTSKSTFECPPEVFEFEMEGGLYTEESLMAGEVWSPWSLTLAWDVAYTCEGEGCLFDECVIQTDFELARVADDE